MKGKTQEEPEAGPADTVQVEGVVVVMGVGVVVVVVVVQVVVVQTAWPREEQTHVLQSCRKVVPGVQVEGEVVVVGVTVVVVVVVVVVVEVEEQVEGQKPYSP